MLCASCDSAQPDDADRCGQCGQPPLLSGRYRFDATLGRGAHGTVYRATDTQTGAQLAIKELPLRHDLDPHRQAMFEREALVLRALSHPAVPRYHGQEIAGSGKSRALYLLQEHIDGAPLTLDARRTEAEVIDAIASLAEILAYLHGLSPPVIHRDLKPANILRRADGRLALIDFGAVRAALADPDLGGNTVAGTFGYMAPEQFAGDASPASDIYGLGAVALALLSRQEPSQLQDRTGALRWREAISVGAGTEALLAKMLAPDPADRFPDGAALLQALRSPAPTTTIEAPAPTSSSSRQKRLLLLGALVLPVLFGLPTLLIMLLQWAF